MKIKVKNISNVEQTFQVDGYNYKTVKPGEVTERDFKDEKSIPDGWEIAGKQQPEAVATSKPKARNTAPVITETNHNATSNDGVITSSTITGLL